MFTQQELAAAAGVPLTYVVADVLDLSSAVAQPKHDLVVLEMGILHYFVDLLPLMRAAASLLKSGGRFVLRDFHPISTKLISYRGKKHKITGDYFSTAIEPADVSFSKYGPSSSSSVSINGSALGGSSFAYGAAAPNGSGKFGVPRSSTVDSQHMQVYLRRWTLGDVVTAVAQAGLCVVELEEEPTVKLDDKGIPKTFTIVAKRL